MRSVLDFAREARIHLRDGTILFGSLQDGANGDESSFRIRPWGVTSWMAIPFDDVSAAAPVKQMGWERHRAIAAAQHAGIFTAAKSR